MVQMLESLLAKVMASAREAGWQGERLRTVVGAKTFKCNKFFSSWKKY